MAVHKQLYIEEIDKERRIIRIKGEGVLNQKKFRQLFKSLIIHPQYTPEMSLFWDLRQANLHSFNYLEFKGLALFMMLRLERLPERHAIVVDHEQYGIMRIWHSIADRCVPKERHLFKDAEEAYRWLLSRQASSKHLFDHRLPTHSQV